LHAVDPDGKDLSFIITKVNYVRQAALPSVYSREDIQSLLAIIDRHNPKGKRDYANILTSNPTWITSKDIRS
jgi:hypothetical protein